MMRSLFAGVSGLKSHQVKMDVLGNNIANVNTTGFKASRVSFAEMFSQTLRGASAPSDERGGTSAQQIGLGTMISSIDIIQGQGNLQSTGGETDMAIEGQGFFILQNGDQILYTRAGAFQPDADGFLVDPSGARVLGWAADAGVLPRADATNLENIRIPLGETIGARASTVVVYRNNVNSSSEVGYEWTTPVEVFDSMGHRHTIQMNFTKTDDNEWAWEVTADSGGIDGVVGGTGVITFDADGIAEEAGALGNVTLQFSEASDIELDLDFSQITQFYGSTTASAVKRDGHPMGTLESFTVDSSGEITGVYSNGRTQTLAQVGLAAFSNPGGLIREGGNIYRESNNSGLRQVGPPGTASRGTVAPGSLEMSNVDLSEQFAEMIITQRGFQANSRIITTSDEMLQELVNLKR